MGNRNGGPSNLFFDKELIFTNIIISDKKNVDG